MQEFPETSIRVGTPADAPALAQLLVEVNDLHVAALPDVFRAVGPDEETVALLRNWASKDDTHLLVADGPAEPLAFALVTLHVAPPVPIFAPRRWAEVELLVVTEAARGHGLGRALMGRAHAWAVEQGAADVRVVVWEFNAGAIRFYEGLGYTTARRTMWWNPEPAS